MKPEDKAREIIDKKLESAGWVVQDSDEINITAAKGVAVRHFSMGKDEADYLLYADRKAIGIIEAKKQGDTLTGVEEQSAKYSQSLPDDFPSWHSPLPFLYESTGDIIRFTNLLDPVPRSREIFHFHTPEIFIEWAKLGKEKQLRTLLRQMPPLETGTMWKAQVEAVQNLERSLANNRPRALIQMATGSGKTFTSANAIYRLLKHCGAHRILFLADRTNLVKQASKEIESFIPPDDNRQMGQLYNIQRLSSNSVNPVSNVVITTVQRVYSMLKGDEGLDELDEFQSLFERDMQPLDAEPLPLEYNPEFPVGFFDFIIVDECHRSIYNLWSQVLEYFDAFLIGLTATPSLQTMGFFRQNLVMEYGHERAVADGVNVDFDIYRIMTQITAQGSTVEAGNHVIERERTTRKKRWKQLDEDLTYTPNQLDRDVVAEDQIRTVITEFKNRLFTELFPGRREVPKTLIFAKDDSHADDIVSIVREVFNKGNDFCQKITYRTGFIKEVKKQVDENGVEHETTDWKRISNLTPEDILTLLRNTYNPRIAVSVDMIATGTDVKPLEIVMFMRNVKSSHYFEQMKGRGSRIIPDDKLRVVTPDAFGGKDHFLIIDCVGVCDDNWAASRPLNQNPQISFKKLLDHVARGGINPQNIESLASRLARTNNKFSVEQQEELKELANGVTIPEIVNNILTAVEPDAQIEQAIKINELGEFEEPTKKQLDQAYEEMARDAVEPLLNPTFRNRILEIKQLNEQIIDAVSKDEVIESSHDQDARDRARNTVEKFHKWLKEKKDEIIAIQALYAERYTNRIKFEDIKTIAQRIERPPMNLTPEKLWKAYETLEISSVRGSGGRQLVDLVSLIRHAILRDNVLVPFATVVHERYSIWLEEQAAQGVIFNDEERKWLDLIADQIASSIAIEKDDFDTGRLYSEGGLGKAYQVFGENLFELMKELNIRLVA